MKRASEVPPVVLRSGSIPVISFMELAVISESLPGLVRKESPLTRCSIL